MKSIVIVFAAFFVLLTIPVVFDFIQDSKTDSTSDTFSAVAITGNYSTNVTLGQDIFDDSVNSVTSISSNASSDSPGAYAFNSVSRVLTVSGLDSAVTYRTLEVDYNIDDGDLPTGMSGFFTILTWFWIFTGVGLSCAAVYAFFVT